MASLLEFREIVSSDIDALFSVRSRTRENAFSKDGLGKLGITVQSTTQAMASGRVVGWVCTHESRVVGFCCGDKSSGEVTVLAVLPEYERRGIGATLLGRVVEWLRAVSAGPPWLAASPDRSTRAHGFYRSLGWRPNGEMDGNGDEILVLETSSVL